MPTPILTTKLYVPPPRPKIVLRPSLIERLNEGMSGKFTLISAPAGFGKTTLISEWVASCGRPAAWLSLDEGDSDPARFISYLVAALQTIIAGIGEGLVTALQSPQPPPTDAILTSLLNEITTMPDKFVLILDDYHVIDSQAVDHALTFLIEHLPSQMHLVIATREDPHLPLARLRGQGQQTELRAADLRFTSSEAADFLNQVMGLNLSAEDIAALEARTEGWIAGLQLAAIALRSPLSLHGRSDTTSFIQAFTGSHRFVMDYLVEEVLKRQTESVRSFLLQTAILDRLCASLCNVVTEREDGKQMLDILERSNLFLVALDDKRQWYRYHHLFADVLQTHLAEGQAEKVSGLHQRASVWYEQNELPHDAIRHALAAEDFERAVELIERIWLAMDLAYQYASWLGWVKALPEDLIRARPVVSVGYAWALLGVGELEASEARLQDAERWLEPADKKAEGSPFQDSPEQSQRMVVVDDAEFQFLPASIAAARAYRALALGDIPGTRMYAQQALGFIGDKVSPHRSQATALLALAEYSNGNLGAAEQGFLKFQEMMWQINDIASAIGITYVLANIKVAQGRLCEAVSDYLHSLQLAENRGTPFFLGVCDLHRGLSELLCEQGDLEAAAKYLTTAQQMGEKGATTGWPHRLRVALARLKESQGDLAGALILLNEAERQYIRTPMPDPPIAALKARAWVRQGLLTEAFAWAREHELSPDDNLSYTREFEHLTLARALIARYVTNRLDADIQGALRMLGRLLQAAEEGGRKGSVIEILILQSLASQAQGDHRRALESLERALAMAEPEGYQRFFVVEGKPMRLLILDFISLIEKQGRSDIHPLSGYVNKLLAAFSETTEANPQTTTSIHKSQLVDPEGQPAKNMLVEPLSERELEVLRLLRSELSGPEIAQHLIVSLNTLRTHTKNIFNKLGVNNRRAAILRAEELDLF